MKEQNSGVEHLEYAEKTVEENKRSLSFQASRELSRFETVTEPFVKENKQISKEMISELCAVLNVEDLWSMDVEIEERQNRHEAEKAVNGETHSESKKRYKKDPCGIEEGQNNHEAEKVVNGETYRESKNRSKKDPSAPKRNPSAFLLFAQGTRQDLRTRYPNTKNIEISCILGQMWREMPIDKKQMYIDREIEERKLYKIAMTEWKKRQELNDETKDSISENTGDVENHLTKKIETSSSDDVVTLEQFDSHTAHFVHSIFGDANDLSSYSSPDPDMKTKNSHSNIYKHLQLQNNMQHSSHFMPHRHESSTVNDQSPNSVQVFGDSEPLLFESHHQKPQEESKKHFRSSSGRQSCLYRQRNVHTDYVHASENSHDKHLRDTSLINYENNYVNNQTIIPTQFDDYLYPLSFGLHTPNFQKRCKKYNSPNNRAEYPCYSNIPQESQTRFEIYASNPLKTHHDMHQHGRPSMSPKYRNERIEAESRDAVDDYASLSKNYFFRSICGERN